MGFKLLIFYNQLIKVECSQENVLFKRPIFQANLLICTA